MNELITAYPNLVVVFICLFVAGLIFKLLFTGAEIIVQYTETKKDDEALDKAKLSVLYKAINYVADLMLTLKIPDQIKGNRFYKLFSYLLDLVIRIKLPKQTTMPEEK